jgi:hypothetical protein
MLTKADIEKYFVAEKHESLLLIIVGLVCIFLAILFFSSAKTIFYRGAAIPLLVLGLLQALVGYVVYVKSDDQRIGNVYAYDMNPDRLKSAELQRIRKVNQHFKIYRAVEWIFVLAGLGLFLLFRGDPGRAFWVGLGITLAIQAAILVLADTVAARRARIYEGQLLEFSVKRP